MAKTIDRSKAILDKHQRLTTTRHRRRRSQLEREILGAKFARMHLIDGKSWRQIGRETGESRDTVQRLAMASMADDIQHLKSSTGDFVLKHLSDIIAATSETMHDPKSTDKSAKNNAANVQIRALQELAKLAGLYAPTQSEHTVNVNDPVNTQIARLVAEMETHAFTPIKEAI